jgi:hypothetical protein
MDCSAVHVVRDFGESARGGAPLKPAQRLCVEPGCGRRTRSHEHRRCELHGRPKKHGAACTVDCCGLPAARAGLCWGHLKRRARGLDVNVVLVERPRDPWDVFMEAVFAFCDLRPSEPEEWDRAKARLKMAMLRYRRAIGDEK